MKTKLFYGSSYDRGLDILLKLWPLILKEYPTATLEVCYGWNLFDRAYRDNQERQEWKDRMNKLMKQAGITHHGRLGKKELQEVRKKCHIWAYPTYFPEINCITALDCQKDGLVPCTMDFAALKETVQTGIKVQGDIYDQETQVKWLQSLFLIMKSDEMFEIETNKAKEFAKKFTWEEIAKLWMEQLKG